MYNCVETASYCHHMPMWNVDWHRYALPLPKSYSFEQQYSGALEDPNSVYVSLLEEVLCGWCGEMWHFVHYFGAF